MICVSINEKNFEKCLDLARKFELAEIRIDLCSLNADQIEKIFSLGNKYIATCRPEYVKEEKRAELLKKAINAGAAYVDVEFESSFAFKKDIIRLANEKGCQVIISYHNFELTPTSEQLKVIVDQSFSMGADVAKLACMVQKPADNARILSLYDTAKRIVAIGMGEEGKISRMVAPLLGAEFTFASVDDASATAPGQVSYEKMKETINMLMC